MPKKVTKRTEKIKQNIIENADICVRCGLCLPHCPTYRISEMETESPRGRIAMAKALAENSVSLTDSMQNHLDNCLSCLACETMCPAKVPYHQLIVNTRELQAETHPPKLPLLLKFLLNHLNWTAWLQRSYRLIQKTGLTKLLKQSRIGKYAAFMPEHLTIADFKNFYEAKNAKGDVAIFIGCINPLCDASTIYKAIDLLNELGFNVHIPKHQACCGALHLHSGMPEQAKSYLQQNAKVFAQLKLAAIITLASGCNSSLQPLVDLINAPPIVDINAFLLSVKTESLFEINSKTTLLIHTPCTLKNDLQQPEAIIRLLTKAKIKNVKQLTGYGCCGAAGLNMWNNSKLANTLAEPLISQIEAEKPDYVVTANIGCQLHLQKNLREKGLKTKVIHPINLIFAKNR